MIVCDLSMQLGQMKCADAKIFENRISAGIVTCFFLNIRQSVSAGRHYLFFYFLKLDLGRGISTVSQL